MRSKRTAGSWSIRQFPIPMRDNETQEVGLEAQGLAVGFPIPMRGNEYWPRRFAIPIPRKAPAQGNKD